MGFTTQQLLERGRNIRQTEYKVPSPGLIIPDYISGPKYNKWLNDIKIKAAELPDSCPLKKELNNTYFFKDSSASTFDKMIGLLESLEDWEKDHSITGQNQQMKSLVMTKDYDVFLSHANADKLVYVNDLYESFRRLGISIFYDKEEIDWGDYWKDRILQGVAKSEFAVIVISKNFFGRDWTERELNEFLNRQNAAGQKIVLPLLYGISVQDLQAQYPTLSEIQCVSSEKMNQDQICILFAKQLIKRLKGIQ